MFHWISGTIAALLISLATMLGGVPTTSPQIAVPITEDAQGEVVSSTTPAQKNPVAVATVKTPVVVKTPTWVPLSVYKGGLYTLKNNSVYYGDRPDLYSNNLLRDADTASFLVWPQLVGGERLAKDSKNLYVGRDIVSFPTLACMGVNGVPCGGAPTIAKVLPVPVKGTTPSIAVKDAKNIFIISSSSASGGHTGGVVLGADPTTFVAVQRSGATSNYKVFYKDVHTVYVVDGSYTVGAKPLSEADAATFQLLPNFYAKDKLHVWSYGRSYCVSGEGHSAWDDGGELTILPNVSPTTFVSEERGFYYDGDCGMPAPTVL